MGFIDLKKYINCPAAIFDLEGRCYHKNEGVPCRIRVGPRRFLNEIVNPEALKLTLWRMEADQVTYLPAEPVKTTVDKNGTLFVDAVDLARNYFGPIHSDNYCSSICWQLDKTSPHSDTFLATPYGAAASYSVWLDINLTSSRLFFAPGALTLCGHDVRILSWSSFDDECGAHSLTLRPLVEKLLSGPHSLSAKKLLKELRFLKGSHLKKLVISTDQGSYVLDASLNSCISISLKDGTCVEDFKFAKYTEPLTMIDVALRLLQANSANGIRTALEDMEHQGLVTKELT